MEYPMIKKWQVYFKLEDGYDNRDTVMKAFVQFLAHPKNEKLEMPGKCILGGRIFGHDHFEDGDEILTSLVTEFRWLREEEGTSVVEATTKSGSKYRLFLDDFSQCMFAMMGDMIQDGRLNRSRYYYLDHEHRSCLLI